MLPQCPRTKWKRSSHVAKVRPSHPFLLTRWCSCTPSTSTLFFAPTSVKLTRRQLGLIEIKKAPLLCTPPQKTRKSCDSAGPVAPYRIRQPSRPWPAASQAPAHPPITVRPACASKCMSASAATQPSAATHAKSSLLCCISDTLIVSKWYLDWNRPSSASRACLVREIC